MSVCVCVCVCVCVFVSHSPCVNTPQACVGASLWSYNLKQAPILFWKYVF